MPGRRLRVVMPMVTFVPGGMGGTETYVRALVSELATRDDLDLTLILSAAAVGSFPGVREVALRGTGSGGAVHQRAWTQIRARFPAGAARSAMHAADVTHYPFSVPVPPASGPWIQSLHDVQHLDLPEMFSLAERAYRRVTYDQAARRADRVITLSEFCKERIMERLGVAEERIEVAHLGVDRERFRPYAGPRQPFVLYPATAWPHKNHSRLIEAMQLVRRERPELGLLLTGGRREALGTLPEWVEHRGHVTQPELVDLYRAASCLAFPSLYEGFGLPPLEAMASGCPVAAADSGSLPEICGDAAVMFEGRSVPDIARGIDEAMSTPRRLVERGLHRASQFGWKACADVHQRAFDEVLPD